jgi:protein-disulfide isomerase
MPKRNDDELFVVKKWHIYLIIATVLSFITGMTVRSLLLGPMPYYIVASGVQPTAYPTPTPSPILSPAPAQPSPTAGIVQVSADDDPALGPQDAPVLIVEFSDFQCGYCARFATETLNQILDTYGDQVRFVYRDFPLNSIHTYAQKAAEATECAFEQGKYWEYSDLLWKNQQALDVDSLKGYAQQSGLETGAFNECLDSGRYTSEVQNDLAQGQGYGVTRTPTFFINGRLLVGAKPFSDFQAMIAEELAK